MLKHALGIKLDPSKYRNDGASTCTTSDHLYEEAMVPPVQHAASG